MSSVVRTRKGDSASASIQIPEQSIHITMLLPILFCQVDRRVYGCAYRDLVQKQYLVFTEAKDVSLPPVRLLNRLFRKTIEDPIKEGPVPERSIYQFENKSTVANIEVLPRLF